MTKNTKLTMASLALLVGGMIYATFRPTSLIMFQWFDGLGCYSFVDYLRAHYGNTISEEWLIYSLPAGLWLFSYLYVIDSIWGGHANQKGRTYFLWILPILSILSEFMQLVHLMPGTFDPMDIVCYVLAIFAFTIIKQLDK